MKKIEAITEKTNFGWRTIFLEPLNVTKDDSIVLYYNVDGTIDAYIVEREDKNGEKP